MLKDRVREILRRSVLEVLKRHDYEKQANLYVRRLRRLTHMIDVQQSRWNDGNCQKFTLNCGVYVPGVTSTFWNTPDPERPKLTDCCVSIRVGMLAPARLDIWWEVMRDSAPENDARTQSELSSVVSDLALPFVNRFQTELDVAQFLTQERTADDRFVEPRAGSTRLVYAGILWRQLGEAEKCSACLGEAVRQARRTPLEPVIAEFMSRFA